MPDWKRLLHERLRLNDQLTPAREKELIDDIAEQLQDSYEEALRNGETESQALALALQHIPDWNEFATELTKSNRVHAAKESNLSSGVLHEGGQRSFIDVLMQFWRDLIYGARILRKNARYTAIAMLTMMLGIGATTVIFSVIHAVILQPLPYNHAERILWIWGKFSQGNRAAMSPPDFQDYRSRAKSFEKIAVMHVMHQFVPAPLTLKTANGSMKLDSASVSSGFFEVFGVTPIFGRTFLDSDERENSNVVVLSYECWKYFFAADPKIVGKQIALNGTAQTVVGVLQQGFRFPLDVDLWTPLPVTSPGDQERRFHFLRGIARLKPGLSPEQGEAELKTIAAQLEKQYPETNHTWTVRVQTLQEQMVGDLHTPLYVIFAAVIALLLIACVNVANLQLAKTTSRQKEIAIRAAMGAGRKRIIGQLFAESLLFSLPAGLLGLLFSYWSIEAFRAVAPNFIPRLQEVHVDYWTLLFALVCSVVTAVLVSVAPAMDVLPHLSAERLKEARFSGTKTSAGRVRHILAVLEISLSLILLAGAGLLLKSFWNLTNVDLGFNPDRLLTVRLTLNGSNYETAKPVIQFVEESLERVRALPGVESVAAGTGIPLVPAGGDRFFTIDGRPVAGKESDRPNAQFRAVTRDYFHTLSIPLLQGRVFSNHDHETSTKVIVINDVLARKFFGKEDAVGKFLTVDDGAPFHAQIIGIVQGTRQNLADPPDPEMYVLHQQSPMGYFLLTVRCRNGSTIRGETIQNALHAIDPNLAFPKFRSMDDIKSQLSVRHRLNAILLAGAALIALLLAAIGIYGVLSFSVEQRKQEIAVRLALGAQRKEILTLVLQNGIQIAAVGVIAGLAGALVLTRLMNALLYNTSPHDPATLAGVSLLLTLVALFACLVPAIRATKTDPLQSLRYE